MRVGVVHRGLAGLVTGSAFLLVTACGLPGFTGHSSPTTPAPKPSATSSAAPVLKFNGVSEQCPAFESDGESHVGKKGPLQSDNNFELHVDCYYSVGSGDDEQDYEIEVTIWRAGMPDPLGDAASQLADFRRDSVTKYHNTVVDRSGYGDEAVQIFNVNGRSTHIWIRSGNAIVNVGVTLAFNTDRSKVESALKAQDPTLDAMAKLAMGTLK
jgi:hypothetical protein